MNSGISLFTESLINSVQTWHKNSSAIETSKDNTKLPTIEYFFWEVNDYCNSKCHSCNIWQRPANKDYLNVGDIKEIFSNHDFSNVKSVIVSGGEPNLHPELVECLHLMSTFFMKGCLFSYSTNGLNPNRVLDDVRRLSELNVNLMVGVSLDGIGDDHDLSRGVKGNFNKVESLLIQLKEFRDGLSSDKRKIFNFSVGSTLTPQTAPHLLQVQKFCADRNIPFLAQMYEEFSYYSSYDIINIDSILNKDKRFGNSMDKNNVHKDSYANYDLLKNDLDRNKLLETIKFLPKNLQYEILETSIKDKPLAFKCGAMTKFFLLHSNGDVSPCLKFAHLRSGNVKDGFTKAWTSDESNSSRVTVANCVGCSNSWATAWSLRHWIFSFIPMIIKSKLRMFH